MREIPAPLVIAAVVAICMLGMWLLSLAKHDASIVDIFWGLGFVVIAALSATLGNGFSARKRLITTLVTIWGLRLALYVLWRNHGQAEDYRYQAMRRRYGDRFWWVSLFIVFGLQGILMWTVSLPVQAANMSASPDRLTVFDAAGVLLSITGLLFESAGDWQLARFKADPNNRGKVMDRGLWAYTRHPNYFGDALTWWGFFLIALPTPAGVWTAIGPLLMTFLLMRVSGVTLLERKLVKTRPEYEAYRRRTSAFVPWARRKNSTKLHH